MTHPTSTTAPLNREDWSEASKRSTLYDFAPPEYADVEYTCMHCDCSAVFTAAAQKEAFEVHKKYIRQGRKLCSACQGKLVELKQKAAAFSAKWTSDREKLEANSSALREWLALLEQLPNFGVGRNEGQIKALTRLLRDAA